MVEAIVKTVASQLNLDQTQVEGGMGLLLNLAKEKLASGDFSQITQALGGDLGNLLKSVPAESASGGGMASGLLQMALSALGSKNSELGALAQLATGFKSLNMDMETVMKFVPVVLKIVEEHAGPSIKEMIEKALK